jgi:hypothetical protein
MRKYFVFLTVLLASALTVAAADLTGNWKGSLTPEDRDAGSALVILKQTGDVVTGSGGQDESDRHEISNGKVMGDTVTFDIQVGEGIMKFVLTLDGDTLTGRVTRERNGQQQTAKLDLKREK